MHVFAWIIVPRSLGLLGMPSCGGRWPVHMYNRLGLQVGDGMWDGMELGDA